MIKKIIMTLYFGTLAALILFMVVPGLLSGSTAQVLVGVFVTLSIICSGIVGFQQLFKK